MTRLAPAPTLGAELPLVTALPFVILLAAIALCPLALPRWWESNRHKAVVAGMLALPIAAYLWLGAGLEGRTALLEHVGEYAAFVALLGSLFVISGGIYVAGSLAGTPLLNTALLAIGAVLANLAGTTGAAMLLIRPLLRANGSRQRKSHIVVFFIFIVANCGGLLTPLGDPPLFLGYLRGVPFDWTLRLWPQWLVINLALLVAFNVIDQWIFNREERERPGSQLEEVMVHEPLRLHGWRNVPFLLGVLGVVVAAGRGIGTDGRPWTVTAQTAVLAELALGAYLVTPGDYRRWNGFRFQPIIEVAVLFAGIFVTMTPALEILNAWGGGQRELFGAAFALSRPRELFWATGALSSVLDNAPTYLTFAAAAAGLHGVPAHGAFLGTLLQTPGGADLIAAVSTGAVFMGALTYIGNGPNFIIKAIAEHEGVRMPSFFAYAGLAIVILLPLFAIVARVFFSG